jgi:hypothetical protein
MSRTYRRKNAEHAHSYYFERFFYDWVVTNPRIGHHWEIVKVPRTEHEIRKHKAVFHSDSHREMTTPMWWYRETMQVPYRRKVRDLNRKVLKMKYLDEMESAMYPDYKRPHNYYW